VMVSSQKTTPAATAAPSLTQVLLRPVPASPVERIVVTYAVNPNFSMR